MYIAMAAAVVPASVKTGKSLQEHYVLSIFMWEAPVCRHWKAMATYMQVVVVLQLPVCEPSCSQDVCALHRWAVNCCYCSACLRKRNPPNAALPRGGSCPAVQYHQASSL